MGKTLPLDDIRTDIGRSLRGLLAYAFVLLIFVVLTGALHGCKKNDRMAWIPPGEFIMGTDERDDQDQAIQLGLPQPWYEDERPRRSVHLPGFYMDRYEVSQRDYLKFIQATGHRPPDPWLNGMFAQGREDDPVAHVDWYDANDFCQWGGKRLPTEEEWEKGARGADGRRYPWGDRFEINRANVAAGSNDAPKAAKVWSYLSGESPYGLFNMVGNVWEWTDSWYLPYPGSEVRSKDFGMKYRVVRGLSYTPLGHYPEEAYPRLLEVYARASTRSYEPPTVRLDDVGFRCAKADTH